MNESDRGCFAFISRTSNLCIFSHLFLFLFFSSSSSSSTLFSSVSILCVCVLCFVYCWNGRPMWMETNKQKLILKLLNMLSHTLHLLWIVVIIYNAKQYNRYLLQSWCSYWNVGTINFSVRFSSFFSSNIYFASFSSWFMLFSSHNFNVSSPQSAKILQ